MPVRYGGEYGVSEDELLFFETTPQMLPLYEALREKLTSTHPEIIVKVCKTQISLRNRHVFATVSLPRRRVKGWPKAHLLLSIGLPCRKESPRIVATAEPYPNRWTNHVILTQPVEIDDTLMAWLEEAYQFAMVKK